MTEWLKQNSWRIAGVSVVAILLLVAVAWGKKQTPRSVPCVAIEYDFRDGKQRMYVEQGELNLLLDKEHLYPVDKPLATVALQRMEQVISNHPMVRTTECFITPRNIVKVQLTQRVPLLRVQKPGDTYFIDTDRKRMEARESVKDSVLIVKGAVSERLATTELADFAKWLKSDKYWCERIKYVDMSTPRMMHLYLKDTQQPRIVVGEIKGFKSKMAKLRTFMENGAEATQGKQYTELDLRFKDQVIGRK